MALLRWSRRRRHGLCIELFTADAAFGILFIRFRMFGSALLIRRRLHAKTVRLMFRRFFVVLVTAVVLVVGLILLVGGIFLHACVGVEVADIFVTVYHVD